MAIVVAAIVAVFGAAHMYGAVTFTQLHSFTVSTDGFDPGAPLVEGPGGFFYGVAQNGGAGGCGTAYKVSPAGAFTLLHTFADICVPTSLMLASDGLFYGTAVSGAGSRTGTIFSMTADGTVTELHVFTNPNGEAPLYPLTEGLDGAFYGTTSFGGANGAGTAFKIDAAGNLTYLHHFGDSADAGVFPSSGLLLAEDGAFYGTTLLGGNPGGGEPGGTVYKMTVAGDVGTVTRLFNFAVGTAAGHTPFGGLVETAPGTFYGTTSGDYAFASPGAPAPVNKGTVFKWDGSVLDTVHSFSLVGADLDGATPYGTLLVGTDGHLYGTTLAGGSPSGVGGGTVFRVSLPSETLEILHIFDGSVAGDTGDFPVAPLTQGTDGKIYGTTGGLAIIGSAPALQGTFFSIDAGDPGPGVTLSDLVLVPSSLVSGATSTGTVTLSGAAPAGGVSVTLSSNNAVAQVPSSVVVAEGQITASFPITTTAFAGGPPVLAEITASHGDVTISKTLTVAPVQLASFTVAPHPIKGGLTSTATVRLTGAAPAGGLLVTITSDKPHAVASTSVLVPAGATTANTPVTTYVVTANTNVKLTATGGGVSLTAPLNVKKK